MEKYQDCTLNPKERAKELLGKMSLEEKMAQVTGLICQPVFTKEETEQFRAMFPYGVGHISALVMAGIRDRKDARRMQRLLQTMAMELSPHGIPAVFHNEGLSGAIFSGAVSFPYGIGRGASFDPELEEQIGGIIAKQSLAMGITNLLCPVLDIARDSRHGRHGEAYGEDPTLVAALGAANVKGLQGQEVEGLRASACAKHFMAYHNSAGGINTAHVELGPRALREIHGKPFQAAIAKADMRAVMPCYSAMDDGPVSTSEEMLTGILREEMGFQGVVLSDYGAVGNVHTVHYLGETMEEAGYLCLKAGMDVELPFPAAYGGKLKQMFEDGSADSAFLDRAVLRVLEDKFRQGLFEHPFGLEEAEADRIYLAPRNQDVALQSARESMVLLKNDGVLPLTRTVKKIALVGPHGDWANHYFGGYSTVGMVESRTAALNSQAGIAQNDGANTRGLVLIPGTNVQLSETPCFGEQLAWVKPGCRTLLDGLKEKYPDTEIIYAHGYHVAGDNREEFEEALQACREADAAILTLGGKNSGGSVATMGEGVDAANINLPVCQEQFIQEVSRIGIPLIGVHFGGRPISSDAADKYLDAILEAWNPGEYAAQAIAEILCGEQAPSGKMPVTTAFCAGQLPMYYNHPNGSSWHQGESVGFRSYVDLSHEPRYCFGHGLSYTEFAYSDLQISKATDSAVRNSEVSFAPEETVRISCKVRNTGKVKGTEVVQLYLRDLYASMLRPAKELQGFARVELAPGEEKRVSFLYSPSQMAFLTRDMKWKIESGRIDIGIGSSSEDIRLKGSFEISEDRVIMGRNRDFWAEVQITGCR